MKKNSLKVVLFICFLSLSNSSFGQKLLGWDFSANTGLEKTALALVNNKNLMPSVLIKGEGIQKSGKVLRTFGGNFKKGHSKNQALASNDFFEFNVQGKEGYKVSLAALRVKLRRNENGPSSSCWMYSLNGENFKLIPDSEVEMSSASPSGIVQPSVNLSNISELQNIPSTTTVSFRLYAWAAQGEIASLTIGKSAKVFEEGNTVLYVLGSVDK